MFRAAYWAGTSLTGPLQRLRACKGATAMPQNRPHLHRDPEPRPDRQQPTRRLGRANHAQKRDRGRPPIVESGLAIEPEDLGIQFLRGATETDQEASDLELRGE